jgi:hypothetical protein
MPTNTPTTRPNRIEPTIWRPVAPTTLRTTVTAIATASALKTRTPQPIEPNSHSPTKSALPTGMRIATNRAATNAIPPAVAKRLISAPISENSALASARCAWMSRTNDARVAPHCWRRDGTFGGFACADGEDEVPPAASSDRGPEGCALPGSPVGEAPRD